MTIRVQRGFRRGVPGTSVGIHRGSGQARRAAQRHRGLDGPRRWIGDLAGRVADSVVNRTITVETKDVERRQNEYVKFTGKSKVMRVSGEHRLEAVDGGTRLTNTFVVDGRLPGVERFFKRNLDRELSNLEDALRAALEDGS